MLYLLGNLITSTLSFLEVEVEVEDEDEEEEEEGEREQEKEKHTFNKIFLHVLSHIAHVCCSIHNELTPYLT
jgi:hypothetical protein